MYAVWKELINTPAVLMRPKAPTVGKRVLLEKIGFTNEGILRDYIFLHGKWKDHYLYSFLRNDNPNYNG